MPACWLRSYLLLLAVLCSFTACGGEATPQTTSKPVTKQPESNYPELADKLTPLARPLPKPEENDWLDRHQEAGQTFAEYVAHAAVRRSDQTHTIYICLIGDFTPEQAKVLEATQEYLGILFDSPVKVRKRVPLSKLPARGQRHHPRWKTHQLKSTYILSDVLGKDVPADALAYLAFTASDLYPDDGWNFVFGQASLHERTGVWSIHRNGDPAESEAAFRQCLLRTLKTAGHETGHILSMRHCIAHHCGMNGSNHRDEADRQPLAFCPVCYRKLCWNLQIEPREHLTKLAAFCAKHQLTEEAEVFQKEADALAP